MKVKQQFGPVPRYRACGFTVIEFLAAFFVLIMLALISLGVFFALRSPSRLDSDAKTIESVLRLARSRTLSSENALSHGVHVETNRVVLFSGALYNPSAPDNEISDVASSSEIYSISLAGGGSDVIFNRLTGTTDEFGTISLRVQSDPDETRTIYVGYTGTVSRLLPPPVGAANLKQDARHVHFTLGWSIQNAQTLQFYFPNAAQTEQIAMSVYFNSMQTEFDWNGSFLVNGAQQVFRVNTHSLDAFNTLLSIHRDRSGGNNTERVQVRIVDSLSVTRNIAEYLADANDTVQVGTDGGTMAIQ